MKAERVKKQKVNRTVPAMVQVLAKRLLSRARNHKKHRGSEKTANVRVTC